MRSNSAKVADEATRPSDLSLVPPPVQPVLPEARALKPNTPFVKRLAFVRTGHPDAKCLLLVLGSWCEVYTDGAAGRCWPKRETVRELCEMGSNRFKRAWRMLKESGALMVRRRGQGLSSMLTVNAVPLLERTPDGPIKPVSERTPDGPIKTGPPVVRRSDQGSDQTRAAAVAPSTGKGRAAAAPDDRHRCPCGHSWPREFGDCCKECKRVQRPKKRRFAGVCWQCGEPLREGRCSNEGCPDGPKPKPLTPEERERRRAESRAILEGGR